MTRKMLKAERLHLIRERLAHLNRQRYAEEDRVAGDVDPEDEGEAEPVVAETVKQEDERCS